MSKKANFYRLEDSRRGIWDLHDLHHTRASNPSESLRLPVWEGIGTAGRTTSDDNRNSTSENGPKRSG
jgi:hypothetical protein